MDTESTRSHTKPIKTTSVRSTGTFPSSPPSSTNLWHLSLAPPPLPKGGADMSGTQMGSRVLGQRDWTWGVE